MISINHLNPSKAKVPFPILKQSMINQSIARKPSCPQILKLRNTKSTSNILVEGICQGPMSARQGIAKKVRKAGAEQNQNENMQASVVDSQHGQKKRSVQTIFVAHDHGQLSEKPQQSQTQEPAHPPHYLQTIQKIIKQNSELSTQLQSKQQQLDQITKECLALEQKYIRLLEVTNQRSESYVKILLQEGESRLSKSKMKNSAISEHAQRLKVRLDGLDISSIKQSKDNSFNFKLSEAIN